MTFLLLTPASADFANMTPDLVRHLGRPVASDEPILVSTWLASTPFTHDVIRSLAFVDGGRAVAVRLAYIMVLRAALRPAVTVPVQRAVLNGAAALRAGRKLTAAVVAVADTITDENSADAAVWQTLMCVQDAADTSRTDADVCDACVDAVDAYVLTCVSSITDNDAGDEDVYEAARDAGYATARSDLADLLNLPTADHLTFGTP